MSAPVLYKSPTGKIWELPKLRAGTIIDLTDEVYALRRTEVLASLADSNDEARAAALRQLDRERGLAADVARWACTARGTVRIIEESLKLLGDGHGIDDLGLDLTRDYGIALALLGFVSAPPTDEVAAGADPTQAQAPAST